jgi:hypothetical protein
VTYERKPYQAIPTAEFTRSFTITLPSAPLRVPDHADHRFRSKPITDSGRSRSLIPEQADR